MFDIVLARAPECFNRKARCVTQALILTLWLSIAAIYSSESADAAEKSAAYAHEGWSFSITPYVWMASLNGDVATLDQLPPVRVNASFSDIIRNTDLAAMLAGEARNGRWGVPIDLVYLDLSDNANTRGPLFGGVDANETTLFTTGDIAYRVYQSDRFGLDLMGGARLWYVTTELKLTSGLLPGRQTQQDEFWADPVVGLRARLNLGRGFYLASFADYGGFGISSDYTWQVGGTLGYQIKDWLSVRAGYRHLVDDYKDSGFVWDVTISGPIVGVELTF